MKRYSIVRNPLYNCAANVAFAWACCFAAEGTEPKPSKMKIELLAVGEIRDPAASKGSEKLVVRTYKLSKGGGEVPFCEISGDDASLKYLGFKAPFYFEDDGYLYGMSINSMNNIFILPTIAMYSDDRSKGPVPVKILKEDDGLVEEFAKTIEGSIKGLQYLSLHVFDSPKKKPGNADGKEKVNSSGGVFAIAIPYPIARQQNEASSDIFFGEILEVEKKDDLISVKLRADSKGSIARLTIKMKRPDSFEVIEAWLNGDKIDLVGGGRAGSGSR